MNNFLKRIGIGLVSGFIGGTVIVGIGGRLAMRSIALLAGRQGGFSWGGTWEVVALGLIIGVLSGIVYAMVEKYGLPNESLNGAIYGIFVFVMLLILPIGGKGAAKGFPDMQPTIYLIFGILLVVYGVLLAFLFKKFMGMVP